MGGHEFAWDKQTNTPIPDSCPVLLQTRGFFWYIVLLFSSSWYCIFLSLTRRLAFLSPFRPVLISFRWVPGGRVGFKLRYLILSLTYYLGKRGWVDVQGKNEDGEREKGHREMKKKIWRGDHRRLFGIEQTFPFLSLLLVRGEGRGFRLPLCFLVLVWAYPHLFVLGMQ